MVKFSEDIENQVLEILKKHEYADKSEVLDYDILGDEVIFAVSINNSEKIPIDDLQKIAEIIGGCFEYITVVNEQYRFYYTYSDDCVCDM
ncbi:MAG: hypothetical protein Q4P18_06315 [Methanobrevibacter sp.]|uniref:hypothetical protein n=1 Tax=Methanobrevibacter sp. TaxID=66852 RepID=UPI0026DED71A|nr:hypothetical protein [Methanobrevibacter sp.]MDO5849128.1 hypothetical protein [Methanobrevibacter sp.]